MPRYIVPGTSYMVTRRTTQRQFLLLPTRTVRQAFRYCLAYAASVTQVEIHAICVLSNHYHLICTDPLGQLPLFTEVLNKLVAKCLNAHHGRWESFWAGGTQASYVRLESPDAVLDKTAYTLANPVAGGLVKYGKQWPGIRLWRPGTYQSKRPTFFFREEGCMPAKLDLVLTPPPIEPDGREATAELEAEVRQRESATRMEFKHRGWRFLGAKAILQQHITDAPHSKEPRRGVSPQVACRDKWRRIEILQRITRFAADYRSALVRWMDGDRAVRFPVGTYQMRVVHRVLCADT